MTHLDIELNQLKKEIIEMWSLVNSQLVKGREALLNSDKDLAREVLLHERRVNIAEDSHPLCGKASTKCNCMLFTNAHIKCPLRHFLHHIF